MGVKTPAFHFFFDSAWAGASVYGGYSHLAKWGLDANAAHVHMQEIRVDAPLDDRSGQVNPFGGQVLHQRFRNDPTAHVATLGAGKRKVPRLINVHLDFYADPLSRLEKEITEKGAGRPSANDPHARAIVQLGAGPSTFASRATPKA